MTWRRAAIAVCATVATLAGMVSLVADAVAADQDPPRLAGPPGGAPTGDGSPPYLSSRTIHLDRLTDSCPPLPDPAPAEPHTRASCDRQVRLPAGASEQDVITALGEPQTRQALGAGSEAWGYIWHSGGQGGLSELADATLRFGGHRLVDAREYIFK